MNNIGHNTMLLLEAKELLSDSRILTKKPLQHKRQGSYFKLKEHIELNMLDKEADSRNLAEWPAERHIVFRL